MRFPFLALLVSLGVLLTPGDVRAALKLPAVFSEHMVIQADRPTPVWGWGDAGGKVDVSFADKDGAAKAKAVATVDAGGRWRAELPALPASTAGRLVVATDKEKMEIADVLVGEVWIGGGQSNMSYLVNGLNVTSATLAQAKEEAAGAKSEIRYFMVRENTENPTPDDVSGQWVVAAPDNVDKCSAVAWYFAVALREKLHRPVGMIVSAVGGTPAEAWMPKEALDATSVGAAIWKRHETNIASYTPDRMAEFKKIVAAWNAAPEATRGPRPRDIYNPNHRYVPTRLYNSMIAGLGDYAAKGIIWFQADGNINNPTEYGELIQALIKAWRKQWKAELPFYYVEMNNMHPMQDKPDIDDKHGLGMVQIREQQQAALKLPKTGVVCSIDLGNADNPTFNAHFPVKKPVGDRLANLALTEVYGQSLGEVQSPAFASAVMKDGRVRLKFTHAAGLHTMDGGAVKGFILKRSDGTWFWANGRINGEAVILWHDEVPAPTEVRYAWASNPIISIVNGAGLPLRPFRAKIEKTPESR